MADLPYLAEYAKSGRSGCKECYQSIDQGALRIAIVTQSPFHDGKITDWYHEYCFFRVNSPGSIAEIAKFNKLKHADQTRIKSRLGNQSFSFIPAEKGKKGKLTKNGRENYDQATLSDYSIEYAKCGQATCEHCGIQSEYEVGVSTLDYDPNFGDQAVWYHVRCFAEKNSEVSCLAGGEDIPGFENLSKEDKKMVKKTIKASAPDDMPGKKLKLELKEEVEESGKEKRLHKKIEKQNKMFHKYRNELSHVPKKLINELLIENSQEILKGRDECLDHLADILTFGALEPCPVCKDGQLVLDTFSYKCTGNLSEWSKCGYTTKTPKRKPVQVPDIEALMEIPILKSYEGNCSERVFEIEPPTATGVLRKEENNIVDWDSESFRRELQDFIAAKSNSATMKLKIQGGAAVDPDSGVVDIAHVYRTPAGTRYTVTLAKADRVAGKNSYYKLQVLKHNTDSIYWLFRSWGRIGTPFGDNSLEEFETLDDAIVKFEDVYHEKTKNLWETRDDFRKAPEAYYPVDVEYSDAPAAAPAGEHAGCALPAPVQELLAMIFDIDTMNKTLLEFELDIDKMPLGKLSEKQIRAGYSVLSELLEYLNEGRTNENDILDFTNRFYTLIPHNFGTDNPPLLNTVETIRNKAEMLDNLLEIEFTYSLLKTGGDEGATFESHYRKLRAEITPLDSESAEFAMIAEYARSTHADTHPYTLAIQQVFSVVREGEEQRFEPFKTLHNRRLLWHGSRVTNFAGILSQGLMIAPPEAPASGYMFGKGIYFADMVTKAANYCCTDKRHNVGLLLLCEVALGNMKECCQAEYVRALPAGTHSVWGRGRTAPDPAYARTLAGGVLVPLGPPLATDVDTKLLYNEFIVYDVAQVNVKYLVQMQFNYFY